MTPACLSCPTTPRLSRVGLQVTFQTWEFTSSLENAAPGRVSLRGPGEVGGCEGTRRSAGGIQVRVHLVPAAWTLENNE